MPTAGAVGPATRVPAHMPGPGLVDGTAVVRGHIVTLAIACQTGGRAEISAPAIRRGTLARGAYTCRAQRAAAQLMLRAADVRRLGRLRSTTATVVLGRGRSTQRSSLTLATRPMAPAIWSAGGLVCDFLGPNQAYVAAPDFTTSPGALIDVRPWVAVYTPAAGWRWIGTGGLDRSRWYRWSAGPSGVAQWVTPAGASNPWTWGPIGFAPGHGTYAVAAFEVVYWYHHPRYVWRFAPSRAGATSQVTLCSYP